MLCYSVNVARGLAYKINGVDFLEFQRNCTTILIAFRIGDWKL